MQLVETPNSWPAEYQQRANKEQLRAIYFYVGMEVAGWAIGFILGRAIRNHLMQKED